MEAASVDGSSLKQIDREGLGADPVTPQVVIVEFVDTCDNTREGAFK